MAQVNARLAGNSNEETARTTKMMSRKVFCIGFHKTGTSSLNVALARLGYCVHGPINASDPITLGSLLSSAYALADQYDAFEDNPWPLLYREMDERFPGSKFILSVREKDRWIRSVVDHFGQRSTPMRNFIYGAGAPQGNEELYLCRFEAHNAEVKHYFRDRPGDLLVMDVSAADAWPCLCNFLGHRVVDEPFPHANPAKNRRRLSRVLKTVIRRILGKQ